MRAALRPATRIVYAETLANPTMAVADLPALAALAHEAGALLVVDSTLAPPVVCRPLEHGADLVLHSATKYFGGHSDVTGGVVTGRADLISRVRARPGRHRRVARAGRGVPAAPRAGDAAGAGAQAVLDRHGVRRRAGQAPGGRAGSTTRAWPAIPATSWPGGCSTPGRRAPGSARS